MLLIWLKKQTATQKYQILKKNTNHDHEKYITTAEFNTMSGSVFNARLTQANVIAKTDFDAKLSGLN